MGALLCFQAGGSWALNQPSVSIRAVGGARSPVTIGEHDRIKKRVDQMFERIDSKGAVDGEAWRLIIYVINDRDWNVRYMALPLLLRLVELRPMYRPVAVALVEERIIRVSGPSDKYLLLSELAMLMGIHPNTSQVALDHASRVAAKRHIDEAAAKFAERALADTRIGVRIGALTILVRAVAMREADRSWALKLVDRQILGAQGQEKRFWKVAREAITGQMEDY